MSASYADTPVVRPLQIGVAILLVSMTTGACAARSGGGSVPTPRPFPGAPVPTAPTPEPRAVAPTPPTVATPDSTVEPPTGVVATAMKFLGVPYRNGGTDPSGFDCSGFVQYIFSTLGVALPREVRDQYRVGQDIRLADVRAGDLLFFETVSRGASHVGMAIGPGQFVHAPSSRGVVRVERYTAQYWASRFVGARRLTPATASGRGSLPGAVRSSK